MYIIYYFLMIKRDNITVLMMSRILLMMSRTMIVNVEDNDW